jgi:hypothetical protein
MQEIIDSIFDMLKKVSSLPENYELSQEFQTLLLRIKNQAFCMQGLLEDIRLQNSQQFQNMVNSFLDIQKDIKVHELVKLTISLIIPIILKDQKIIDSLKYRPVNCSNNIVTAFYKSEEYIYERFRLAEENPQEYIRQGRFDIHGLHPGQKGNYNELYAREYQSDLRNPVNEINQRGGYPPEIDGVNYFDSLFKRGNK